MKKIAWKVRFLAVGAAVFLLGACDIDQTEEGDMPEVEVQEGELPEYDVEGPDVEVSSDTDTIIAETPEVDVEIPDDEDDVEE